MTTRESFTDPYTIRERILIRKSIYVYDVRRFFESGMWHRLSRMVPRKLAYWCVITVWAAETKGNEHPDSMSVSTLLQRWEHRA